MSYIHCHNCGWDNDDFLEDYGGNKGFIINFIKSDLKNIVSPDYANHVKNKRLTALKHLSFDLKHLLKLNFSQKYRSYPEFNKKNPLGICPQCGKKGVDID